MSHAHLLSVARAPVQVAYGASGGLSATSSVSYPAGIVAGMGLLMLVEAAHSVGSVLVTTPTGWTLVGNLDYTTTAFQTSRLFFKIADGTESGTLTITGVFDSGCNGWMIRTTDQVSGYESATSVNTAASSASVSMNSVTTSIPLGLAVTVITAANTATTVAASTGESGGDWTEALAEATQSFGPVDWQIATMAAAGTISGGTATLGAARTQRCVLSCALKAA